MKGLAVIASAIALLAVSIYSPKLIKDHESIENAFKEAMTALSGDSASLIQRRLKLVGCAWGGLIVTMALL